MPTQNNAAALSFARLVGFGRDQALHRPGHPKAARKVITEVRRQTRILIEHPLAGRPGRAENTRELLINPYPYIATYRVEADEVQILAVVHTSRRWPESFGVD